MRKALVVTMCLIVGTAAYAAPRYVAVPLGTLGGESSVGYAINALAQVAGTAQAASGEWRAFVYSDGTLTAIEIPGQTWSKAVALNAPGEVAGCATIEGKQRGFVYRDGNAALIPAVNGKNIVSCAVGINGAGHVVGHQGWDFQYSVAPSYLFVDGRFEDIPQTVAAVSNSGDYAGTAYSHLNAPQAWATGTALRTLLTWGRESYATAINNRRQVTGTFHPDPTNAGPFHAYLYSDGALSDLGSLRGVVIENRRIVGGWSFGYGINDSADVVGMSDGRAFLYTGGTMHDLNALVVAGLDGVVLTEATGINDAGYIVANGCATEPPYPAPCKAFRLDPLPDANNPATVPTLSQLALALLALMIAACGIGVRRRR